MGGIDRRSSIIIKKDGRLEIEDLRTVKSKDKNGNLVEIVVSRAAETKVIDDKNGVVLSSSIVPYGSVIFIKEGAVKKGDKVITVEIPQIMKRAPKI